MLELLLYFQEKKSIWRYIHMRWLGTHLIYRHLLVHRQRSRHVTRQQLTQLAFRPPFLGLFTKIQTSISSEFSGQKGMPCFASSLLDSNRRQRALQILNGPTGQEIKILVETACFFVGLRKEQTCLYLYYIFWNNGDLIPKNLCNLQEFKVIFMFLHI